MLDRNKKEIEQECLATKLFSVAVEFINISREKLFLHHNTRCVLSGVFESVHRCEESSPT